MPSKRAKFAFGVWNGKSTPTARPNRFWSSAGSPFLPTSRAVLLAAVIPHIKGGLYMTLSERVSEYVRACFTGLWIESHEHQDALAAIAQLCQQEGWRLATWNIDSGLQV